VAVTLVSAVLVWIGLRPRAVWPDADPDLPDSVRVPA
jgi:hypothetical protein